MTSPGRWPTPHCCSAGRWSWNSRWFRATLRTHAGLDGARRTALVGAEGRLLAAAVVTPPGATPAAGARALWAARTGLRCGPRALVRTLRYLDATGGGVPPEAWTLEFVGVRPGLTGPEWAGSSDQQDDTA